VPLDPAELRELDQIRESLGDLHSKFDSVIKTIAVDYNSRLAKVEQQFLGLESSAREAIKSVETDVAKNLVAFEAHARAVLSVDEKSFFSEFQKLKEIVSQHRLMIGIVTGVLGPVFIAELIRLANTLFGK
jgi:hypothetical protein